MAIGRPELASMQHISDVAFTINELSNIENRINELIKSPKLRADLSKRAKELAIYSHDNRNIANRVKSILTSKEQ